MKKSTKIIAVIIIVVAAALIIINNFVGKATDKLIAKVNENEIYLSDINEMASQYGFQLSSEDTNLILDQLINNEVVKIYAQKTGMVNDPDFKEDFEWQRNELKKELLINAMLEDMAKKNTDITEKDYTAYVQDNPYVKIKTIFIPSQEDTTAAREKIYQAYDKLQTGSDFEKVQKKYVDKAYRTPDNKGELIKYDVLQSILPTNERMPNVGEFTEPILTDYGYYIIRRYEDPSITEIIEEVGADIKNEKEGSYVNEFLKSFKTDLTINSANLQKALDSNSSAQNNLVIASKGNMVLTWGTLKKYLDFFLTEQQLQSLDILDFEDIATQIALQEFLYQKAVKENYENSMNFVSQWEAQSQEFDKNYDDYVVQQVFTNVIYPSIQVSDAEIEKFYNDHKEDFTVDGVVQKLEDVRDDINNELSNQKYEQWFQNVIDQYNITIETYEKNL
ncbi:MAG TPA: hypothetical protein ENG70_05210 [Candidatus Cloacimonetes bacterium]|nr:hypothetical protein [Candidatus Cloacimonadota bacterium]HEX38237.1 hypothetical protein [Candidatus Cloacimonadota bacterium]